MRKKVVNQKVAMMSDKFFLYNINNEKIYIYVKLFYIYFALVFLNLKDLFSSIFACPVFPVDIVVVL